ncbi:MAG: protein kinase domain-containing protein [Candidatus Xenobium sp.]|jgi:tRNA A-37 threonylcarbamoyl transferase component Bud32
MARELLPGHELCEGRYEVIKTLAFGEEGGVYTIRERESRQVLLLKEVIPPPSMPEEEVDKRVEQFREALLILARFDHPNLSKIYLHFSEGRRQYVVMERVEGVTLKTLLDMSVKPLPEPQVLRWAMDLCDALHYMHDRPEPFIFDVLNTTHIMMTSEEQLKLINYGLDRFFDEEETRSFSANREVLADEMRSLGDTLVFLLTRKPPGPFGLTGDEGISEPLSKILVRLLTADGQRTFASFEELKKAFDRVLNPPTIKIPTTKAPQKPWVQFLDLNRLWQDALWAYMKQPLWLVASELLGVLVLALLTWYFLNPPIHPREGPAAYVACGREIVAVDAREKKVLTRIAMDRPIHSLVSTPEGTRLYAASPDFPSLFLLNSLSNRVLGLVPVGPSPSELIMGTGGDWLYVLHSRSGQIGFVRVSHEPLPLEVESGVFRPKDSMLGVFTAGPGVQGLAATRSGKTEAEQTEAQARSPQQPAGQKIFASSLLGNRITALEPSPLKVLATRDVEAPGPLALTLDARTLLVAQTSTSHILTYQAANLEPGPRILQVGGSNIQQILISPNGQEIWSVNASGTLGVIGLEDRKLRSTVELQGKAAAACWYLFGNDAELWVAISAPNQIVVVNPSTRMVRARIPVGPPPTDIWMVQ